MAESKSDKKQDIKATKGLSPKGKSAFAKADAKMDAKGISKKADAKADKALVVRIKKGKK